MEKSLQPLRKRWYVLVKLFGYSSVRFSLGFKLSPSQLDKLESAATSIIKETPINNGIEDDSLPSLFPDSIITYSSK